MRKQVSNFVKKRLFVRHGKYVDTFSRNESGSAVLADLKRFCKIGKDNFSTDHATMAYKEGQKSVFNRIVAITNLTQEEIDKLKEE